MTVGNTYTESPFPTVFNLYMTQVDTLPRPDDRNVSQWPLQIKKPYPTHFVTGSSRNIQTLGNQRQPTGSPGNIQTLGNQKQRKAITMLPAIFNAIKRGLTFSRDSLIKQSHQGGSRNIEGNMDCKYFGENDTHCGIGMLLDTYQFKTNGCESDSPRELKQNSCLLPEYRNIPDNILDEMQMIHDNYETKVRRYDSLAGGYYEYDNTESFTEYIEKNYNRMLNKNEEQKPLIALTKEELDTLPKQQPVSLTTTKNTLGELSCHIC